MRVLRGCWQNICDDHLMRLLLDINILLDTVYQRPGESASAAVIASCGSANEAWLAWHSVATLFYLIGRHKSAEQARVFIADLLSWARVATTGHGDVLRALDWSIADFEDALQASAALACGATYIITRNGRDFINSPVPAITPEEFLSLRFSPLDDLEDIHLAKQALMRLQNGEDRIVSAKEFWQGLGNKP
ncbi:hypothetical protein CCP3SC1_960002 [Gammaproteobacteria bacterium]